MTTFEDLNLVSPLLRAIRDEGYTTPTPIQLAAIPKLLERRDLLGCAQTGTGKTAAFALPILQILRDCPRPSPRCANCLILTPTRELAIQIDASFAAYGHYLDFDHTVVFGGVNQNPQVAALSKGVDVLVATPGRLLDLMGQGHVHLDQVGIFVLDEADRMLDMGFIHDVRRIIKDLPTKRQTLLFSATMPMDIATLARNILIDPIRVEVAPAATTVELVDQRVLMVNKADKPALLAEVLRDPKVERVLIFTRTKHGANHVARDLEGIRIQAEAIHGNKSQAARQRALENFKAGRTRVLVATDIAARGIDVEGISHVINYDLPNIPESYVHRIGRTARAGAGGSAISFCVDEERPFLRDIEKLIRQTVQIQPHRFAAQVSESRDSASTRPPQRRPSNGRGNQRSWQGR